MSLNKYERNLLKTIKKFGWQCTAVWADDEGPGFAYSIGLWESLGTPELITFGLDTELMHQFLWEMFRQLKAGGTLSDGARWSGLITGFDCISRPVHPSQIKPEYLNSAIWYREYRTSNKTLEAYQLFWPVVEQGLFPWEAGCDARARASQPLLYLPADESPA